MDDASATYGTPLPLMADSTVVHAPYKPSHTAAAISAALAAATLHSPRAFDPCDHVLQQPDLVKVILGFMEFVLPDDVRSDDEFRVAMLMLIQALFALATVSRAFYSAVDQFRWDLWMRADADLGYFNGLACQLLNRPREDPRAGLSTDYALNLGAVYEARVWARALYNYDIKRVALEDLHGHLEYMLCHLPPDNFKQLILYLQGRCACCDGQCELYGPRWNSHASRGPPLGCQPYGAFLLHPYDGVIVPRKPLRCGCTPEHLQGTWLPHTHFDHFVRVKFIHGMDCKFVARVEGLTIADTHQLRDFPTATRHVVHFLVAAYLQPWYATCIARLFQKRAARRLQLKRCCQRPLGGTRSQNWPHVEFKADVCVFTPRMPCNHDRSLQQIFDLSRNQVLATIRRGRLLLREQQRLK